MKLARESFPIPTLQPRLQQKLDKRIKQKALKKNNFES